MKGMGGGGTDKALLDRKERPVVGSGSDVTFITKF